MTHQNKMLPMEMWKQFNVMPGPTDPLGIFRWVNHQSVRIEYPDK